MLGLYMCVWGSAYVCMCKTCYLLQDFLCSHNCFFCEGLYPLHNFLLGVCWSLTLKTDRLISLLLCFEDMKHHAVVIITIKSDQLENVSKEQELVPSL